MPRIPATRVATAAWRAGWRNTPGKPFLTIAVAIAAGESGFNTDAHNPRYPDDSFGLWQINGLAHRWIYQMNWRHPDVNAQAAFRVYRQAGHSFRPWTVYTRGIYRQYLGIAAIAVEAAQLGPGGIGEGPGGGRPIDTSIGGDWDFAMPIKAAGDRILEAGRRATSYATYIHRAIGD